MAWDMQFRERMEKAYAGRGTAHLGDVSDGEQRVRATAGVEKRMARYGAGCPNQGSTALSCSTTSPGRSVTCPGSNGKSISCVGNAELHDGKLAKRSCSAGRNRDIFIAAVGVQCSSASAHCIRRWRKSLQAPGAPGTVSAVCSIAAG